MDASAADVGPFSWLRWGVGSIAITLTLLTAGAFTLYQSYAGHSTRLLVLASVLLLASAVVITVKVSEEIHPVKRKEEPLIGARGTVIQNVRGYPAGVVKVNSQLWSARSNTPLSTGEEIRVVGIEGLHLWVERDDDRT